MRLIFELSLVRTWLVKYDVREFQPLLLSVISTVKYRNNFR